MPCTVMVAARDASGVRLLAGVYVVRVEAGGRAATRRRVVIE